MAEISFVLRLNVEVVNAAAADPFDRIVQYQMRG
jgi:hypothetical protein